MQGYHRPDRLDDALAVLARGDVTVAAGCTDLFPATEAPRLRGPVLDITAIAGLSGIVRTDDGWRIGATTSWSALRAAELPPVFDMLKAAAGEIGSVQIQNAGTVAGNLCNASPAADGVPPLLALDARVELASAAGRREMALAEFLTGPRQTRLAPGELMTAVVIPETAARGVSAFLKLGARRYLVISIAMVAVRLDFDGRRLRRAAVAVGACGPVAARLAGLERALCGLEAGDLVATVTDAAVAEALSPISDIRADAAYRAGAAAELVRRALAGLVGEADA